VTDLSENEGHEGFVHARVAVDELKEVHATAVLLHHHLEEMLVLEHIQHLANIMTERAKVNDRFGKYLITFKSSEW
jgi:hypothetical protein